MTKRWLLSLLVLLSVQPSFAVSKAEVAIPQTLVAPTSEISSNDLQVIDQNLTEQVTHDPQPDEKVLNLHERWMLSKIVFTLVWRGLLSAGTTVVGKIIPEADRGNNMPDLSEEDLKRSEMNILRLFQSLVDRQALAPYLTAKLEKLMKLPIIGPKLRAMSPESRANALQFLITSLEDAVRTKALTRDTQGLTYVPWTLVSDRYLEMMKKAQYSSYEIAGNSTVDEARILTGGHVSFALREQLFARAKKTIDILVWAVYDDSTGQWLLDQIRAKKKQGVTVRLIVDGQVALRPGYHQRVDDIQRLGVQVIKWMNPHALFAGQHRKMLIIDGAETIAGGLNFGDEYSGLNPQVPMWLDTDLYLRGKFSSEVAQKFFDQFWDEAITNMNLPLPTSPARIYTQSRDNSQTSKQKQVLLLNHDPVKFANEGSPIYRAFMNDLRLAHTSVDIENAYVVVIPAFVEAVREATARGVKVRVFTNSTDSVDEKSIGEVMMITCQKLLDAGAEVYLRKGTTLHSKFMVVDGFRSYVTSYNFHPRSEKMEGEMALRIDDAEFAQRMTTTFESEITDQEHARRVLDRQELNVPSSLKLWVLLRLMYDQL